MMKHRLMMILSSIIPGVPQQQQQQQKAVNRYTYATAGSGLGLSNSAV